MNYMVRMVRGKVVVHLLNDHGKTDRTMEFEPDYADLFADALTEHATAARKESTALALAELRQSLTE